MIDKVALAEQMPLAPSTASVCNPFWSRIMMWVCGLCTDSHVEGEPQGNVHPHDSCRDKNALSYGQALVKKTNIHHLRSQVSCLEFCDCFESKFDKVNIVR